MQTMVLNMQLTMLDLPGACGNVPVTRCYDRIEVFTCHAADMFRAILANEDGDALACYDMITDMQDEKLHLKRQAFEAVGFYAPDVLRLYRCYGITVAVGLHTKDAWLSYSDVVTVLKTSSPAFKTPDVVFPFGSFDDWACARLKSLPPNAAAVTAFNDTTPSGAPARVKSSSSPAAEHRAPGLELQKLDCILPCTFQMSARFQYIDTRTVVACLFFVQYASHWPKVGAFEGLIRYKSAVGLCLDDVYRKILHKPKMDDFQIWKKRHAIDCVVDDALTWGSLDFVRRILTDCVEFKKAATKVPTLTTEDVLQGSSVRWTLPYNLDVHGAHNVYACLVKHAYGEMSDADLKVHASLEERTVRVRNEGIVADDLLSVFFKIKRHDHDPAMHVLVRECDVQYVARHKKVRLGCAVCLRCFDSD
jgi:hypothetical protein